MIEVIHGMKIFRQAGSRSRKGGVTEAVLAEAESIPELSSKLFPEKFARRETEEKESICNENLRALNETAKAKAAVAR